MKDSSVSSQDSLSALTATSGNIAMVRNADAFPSHTNSMEATQVEQTGSVTRRARSLKDSSMSSQELSSYKQSTEALDPVSPVHSSVAFASPQNPAQHEIQSHHHHPSHEAKLVVDPVSHKTMRSVACSSNSSHVTPTLQLSPRGTEVKNNKLKIFK